MEPSQRVWRIVIADDHELVREGLSLILKQRPQFTVVGEAASGHEVLPVVEATKPDILLLDVAMPGRAAAETVQMLGVRHSSLKVVVVTSHPEDQHAILLLRAGAQGYVSKTLGGREFLHALDTVVQGKRFISPLLAERIAMNLDPACQHLPHERLSPRELQVMCLIASGRSTAQIASEIAVSVKTVSTYRTRMMEKMGMDSLADVIRYSVRAGLLELSGAPSG